MNINEIYEAILTFLPKDKVKINEPLSHYTHTKIGGVADILVFPTEYEEIENIFSFSHKNSVETTVLGNASNVIIKDEGIRGVVINLTKLVNYRVTNNKIVVQSGTSIIDISGIALEHSLTGLEFACGIPGSIGGAVFMNAGAYGGEVADVLESVLVVTSEGLLKRLSKDELALSYRHSSIAENGYIVVEATFTLIEGEYSSIKEKMDELTLLREEKQPLEFPSCGSVFKRPSGYFAGKLIQDSGLQGYSIGGAEVSRKHAGFIVNKGDATSTDYLSLIQHIQQTVKENFNVELETEVRIIGGN